MSSWCSWLSRLPNTQKVSSSILLEDILAFGFMSIFTALKCCSVHDLELVASLRDDEACLDA